MSEDAAMNESRLRVTLSDIAVDDELLDAVLETVRSGWWSMGPRVEEFEREFAEFCSAPHAVAVANGTAALHLGLLAVGCGPGDEVIVPSLNFVAAANAIVHTGAEPVFCDIVGPDELNLDPADVEAAVGPRTKAVVALHYAGFPCAMDAISEVASRHGLAVVEDAAHAPGASLGGRMCGTLGTVGCFSFFSNKNLPVGEGGMILTADEELAEQLRLLRSHGMTTLTWDRHRGHASSYDVVLAGFNYRLDEVRAAGGIVQLSRPVEGEEGPGVGKGGGRGKGGNSGGGGFFKKKKKRINSIRNFDIFDMRTEGVFRSALSCVCVMLVDEGIIMKFHVMTNMSTNLFT